jgi:hypothetical protein
MELRAEAKKEYRGVEMNGRDGWFAEKRSLWIRGLLKEFHGSYHSFLVLYAEYLASGRISFGAIEQLVGSENRRGPLWRLKDNCHRLWREVDLPEEMNGRLLDWVMGSLFHEAMKLKENAYISRYYRPLSEKMSVRPGTDPLLTYGREFERLMKGATDEISIQMENLGLLFGRANYLLRLLMNEQKENGLLLRYLLENEQVVVQLWSESLGSLFHDMFAGAPEQGYRTAAKSYQADHWEEQALTAFARAGARGSRPEDSRLAERFASATGRDAGER